jgi:hypothetical protein
VFVLLSPVDNSADLLHDIPHRESLDEIQQLFTFNIGPWKLCKGGVAEDRRGIIEEEVYS